MLAALWLTAKTYHICRPAAYVVIGYMEQAGRLQTIMTTSWELLLCGLSAVVNGIYINIGSDHLPTLGDTGYKAHRRLWTKREKGNPWTTPAKESHARLKAESLSTAVRDESHASCSPFEKVLHEMMHDARVTRDITLGRRIGLYQLRGEIGAGNFSHVRLGIHVLIKGEMGGRVTDL